MQTRPLNKCLFFIQEQCPSFVLGLSEPTVAALLVDVACPLVGLEDIQPDTAPTEFTAAELIDPPDYALPIPFLHLLTSRCQRYDVPPEPRLALERNERAKCQPRAKRTLAT